MTVALRAEPLVVINSMRTQGCPGLAAVDAPVERSPALDVAARELAKDIKLGTALARAGYSATTSASFHVRGSSDDESLRRILAERYCSAVTDSKFTELGVHRRRDETWLVLAHRAPPRFAALEDYEGVVQRVLDLVNAARSQARDCGREHFSATTPLEFSTALMSAALLHAGDMARQGEASHRGSDGSNSGERMTRSGYVWRASGENVAAGQPDADAVVVAWLDSPGHCATLMAPQFTDTGIAFALAPTKNPAVYWVQEFAAPR